MKLLRLKLKKIKFLFLNREQKTFSKGNLWIKLLEKEIYCIKLLVEAFLFITFNFFNIFYSPLSKYIVNK